MTRQSKLESHQLQKLLGRFHAARVLCIGDIMLDRFIYGRVDRVSAEAPVQILDVDTQRAMLGGVGNVGRNVVALDAHAVVIAVTGDDAAAGQIRELVESEEHLTSRLIVEAGRSSTVKTRYIAGGQQLLRADHETTEPILDATARRVIDAIRTELSEADVMVLSDYTKGVLTDEVLAIAIAEAKAAGVPVIADPKRREFKAYSGVTILKPNQAELAGAAHLPCRNDEEVEVCARKLIDACEIDALMVSRSERGMSLIKRDSAPLHLPARAREVFDVSGAGDTVVATSAVALAAGADLVLAAKLANVAGGIVVGKLGTASVSRNELTEGVLMLDGGAYQTKLTSTEAAVEAAERWRKQGHKVGFTNGCFDLLHPGHISLLSEAKAACGRLIVGLNSDDSVKRLKGESRPVQDEKARAIVLASLSVVDMVVIFSDDTPIQLIDLLTPDVLIKGGDYTIDDVVGADVVRAYGGEVKLAKIVPGHSSSQVIAKMSDRRPSRRSVTS